MGGAGRLCVAAALCWACAPHGRVGAAGYEGYVYQDPAKFDPDLSVEAAVDAQRRPQQCFCGESQRADVWVDFYEKLHEGLQGDPGFRGDWVHELCGRAYPVIFRVVYVEPETDAFTLHGDCPAGVLAMIAVCAQSSALQQAAQAVAPAAKPPAEARKATEGPRRLPGAGSRGDADDGAWPVQRPSGLWSRTPRVVLDEGENVGDLFGPVPLEQCLAACEARAQCLSFAFGPNGCHLKARCVAGREIGDEDMVPEGVQGSDYRTVFRDGCEEGEGEGRQSHMEEMQNMMTMLIRSLEFAFHCLDASPWPFTLQEILMNYALSCEAPEDFRWVRASGRSLGPSANPGPEGGPGRPPQSMAVPGGGSLVQLAPKRFALLRLQVRWTRGLEMEAAFWRTKLSLDKEENNSLERLHKWLATGEVNWILDGDDVCGFLADTTRRVHASAAGPMPRPGVPRILNAGSGPFAPGPLKCGNLDAKLWRQTKGAAASVAGLVPVVAADGLARYYVRVLDEHQLLSRHMPVQCPVEELHSCWPPAHFDVVHMRNSLDHAFDPLLGIEQLLHVVRPGGWVLLRHARNEGVAGSFRNGLHQWAFDVEAPAGSRKGNFIIWNPELRLDVTSQLLGTGLAAEVNTELRDHPNGPEAPEDERYVWVDIRKPTLDEVAARIQGSLA